MSKADKALELQTIEVTARAALRHATTVEENNDGRRDQTPKCIRIIAVNAPSRPTHSIHSGFVG